MYDKMKLWMDANKIEGNYIDNIPALLYKPLYKEKSNGNWCITGSLNNLIISVGKLGVSIEGSPNKFWHGYNHIKLTRQELQHTIEKLSDTFSFEVKLAKATKLDIAHNFVMDEPVLAYYPYLGSYSRFNRVLDRNSLYYRNKRRTLIFYDKMKELKAKKVTPPLEWQNKNILRFEVRFKSRLLQLFNRQTLTAEDLTQEGFYVEIVDRWAKEYFSITKNKIMTPRIDKLTSKKASEYLLSAFVESVGQNELAQMIQAWQDKFTTPKEEQRFKKKIQNLKGLTIESELIQELDKKISMVQKNYR